MRAWYHVTQHGAATLALLLGNAASPVACKGAAHEPRFAANSALSDDQAAAGRPARLINVSEVWESFPEMQRAPAANEQPFRAWGHFDGRYMATVRVSAEAREDYRALSEESSLPAGTIVAMFQHDAQQRQAGPVFAMRKLAPSRWEFLVTEPDGRMRERGTLPLCARCHSEGVADHLFGLPRESVKGPPR